MKKLIVLFSMMFFIMGSAFAQQGIQAAGVHLTYGTEIESFGIGVKYQYIEQSHPCNQWASKFRGEKLS